MGFSKVVASIATLQLLLARRALKQTTTSHLADKADEKQAHEEGFDDIDSAMSALLADSGVIREDTINKAGDKYTLRVDSGNFEPGTWTRGTFKLGGAYGGHLAGMVGGLPGMLAGGAVGYAAGDRAASMLAQILQGSSVAVSQDWQSRQKVAGLRLLKEKSMEKSIASQIMSPTNEPIASQVASQITSPTNEQPAWLTQANVDSATLSEVPAVKKEATFFTSIQRILGMGNRSSALVTPPSPTSMNNPVLDAIMQQTAPQQQTGYMASLFQPYMETTDRKVTSGLDQALHSNDPKVKNDAKVTVTLLELLRRYEEQVVLVVV